MKKNNLSYFYFLIRFSLIVLFMINISAVFFYNDDSQKARLLFNASQTLIMLLLTFLPPFIEQKRKFSIPNFMEIFFIVFCFFHFILGEISHFYLKFWWWDSALHFLSGVLIAILGFSIINMLNKSPRFSLKLSPGLTVFCIICFALSLGALWEIFEFLCDEFLLTNMQRYQSVETKVNYIGHDALNDTMKDLILDLLGAFFTTAIMYRHIRIKSPN